MRLITQVTSFNTSSMLLKRFPRSGFFNFGNDSKSGGLSPPDFELFRSIEEVSNEVTRAIRRINNEGVHTGIQDLRKRWTTVIKHNGDYIEGL
jgi:hypothetical protein